MTTIPPRDASLRFLSRLNDYYSAAGRQAANCLYVDNDGIAAWMGEFHLAMAMGWTEDQAWEAVQRQIDVLWGVVVDPPPVTGANHCRPLQGYLRRGPWDSWADDSGPRMVKFCSWFPGLRIEKDDPDESSRQLDRMIGRWHGPRIFWHLASAFWEQRGLSVNPYWTNFDEVFYRLLGKCRDRGLRVSLTTGDLQFLEPVEHQVLFRRVAELCRGFDEQTVSLFGVVNEARVNSHQGEDWKYWAHLSELVQSIYPWGMHGLSDPDLMEEPSALRASARPPATCALIHGTRTPMEDALRRCFNLRFEGQIGKPVMQDEWTGMGDDVYQPTTDPAAVFAGYTMHLITGQATTFFQGAGLRNRKPLDTPDEWGFVELPKLWHDMRIPENIASWELLAGHRGGAPLNPESFADRGTGPARCDQAISPDGDRAFAIPHHGRGAWHFTTDWDAEYTVWTLTGAAITGRVRAGEELPTPMGASDRALVIELNKL